MFPVALKKMLGTALRLSPPIPTGRWYPLIFILLMPISAQAPNTSESYSKILSRYFSANFEANGGHIVNKGANILKFHNDQWIFHRAFESE